MSEIEWKASVFLIGLQERSPEEKRGFVAGGLGLDMRVPPSPKGRRRAIWVVTHINTGLKIAHIIGNRDEAFRIGAEMARCGEWDFIGLEGYRNACPDLKERFVACCERFPKQVEYLFSGHRRSDCERAAREIQMARN